MKRNFHFRCGVFDFQIGECHDEVPFKPAEYVRASAEAGMKAIVFTCKDAYGDAFYDSPLVSRNAVIKGDFLHEAIEAGKRHDVDIIAYFNVLLDDKVAAEHPEYRMVDSNGKPVIAYDYYRILCPNSPYYKVIRERIWDVVRRYDIQGVFMDITYFQPDTCFCEYCRREFRDRLGYALLPEAHRGTKDICDRYAFQRETRYNLLHGLTDTIHGLKDLDVLWNGSGSYQLGENEVDAYSACLTSEFHAPDYLEGIVRAKWMHSREKPFIMSMPYELGSWGDWTINPETTLDAVFSSVISNGGGIFVNHVPYPSGEFASSVNKSVLGTIRNGFGRIKEVEPWLENARSVPDTAVVLSLETKRMLEWDSDETALGTYFSSLKGATKMLLEGGRHFDILTEDSFRERTSEYRVVIFPDTACLQNDTESAAQTFVQNGGCLIASGPTSLFETDGQRRDEFGLSDLLGIEYQGESEFSVDYIYDLEGDLAHGVPDNPILVQKSGFKTPKVSPKGVARKWATLVEPLFEATLDRHVYHQHAHPARRSEYPAMILNQTGRGQSLYIAPGIFSSYIHTGSPWLRQIFLNALSQVHPKPCVLVADAPSLHVTLMKQGDRYILHLVNLSDARFDVSKSFMTRMIPIRDAKVRLQLEAERIFAAPDQAPLEFSRTGEGVEFVVPRIDVHKVIVVETRAST